MLINSIGYRNPSFVGNNNIRFGANPQKRIVELLASENLGKFKMTFDEAKRICEMMGHTVEQVQGSHAKIRLKDNSGIISMVMPHNTNKYISIVDKKKLIYIITGRFRDAFRIR